jgi:radical SAM protein with 4Fe4S-binding SPASM domain
MQHQGGIDMEFIDLSRYVKIKKPIILLSFKELRQMKPVLLTHDLKLAKNLNNIEYAKSLGNKGYEVVPIKKMPFPLKTQSFPERVMLEMTSVCNFACRMCPRQNLQRPKMDMPSELFRKMIDEINSYGVEGLWLYHLGESLLHKYFEQNIKYISNKKNLGVIWMSTNGQLFDTKNINIMLNSNIDFINFSMHAITEETYKTVAPGDFKTVQNNLETFFKLKPVGQRPFLHLQMIEQETTKHEVDAFIKKYYKRADIVSINMLEYVNLPNNQFGLKQRERKPLTTCQRISRNDCFIMSDGHVTVCDVAYNHEIDLGNIKQNTLYNIWNGSERKRLLELNKKGKMSENEFCRKCTDYDLGVK